MGLNSEDFYIYCDADAPETIEHMLCECEQLEERRRKNWGEKVKIEMMLTHPKVCRKILVARLSQL